MEQNSNRPDEVTIRTMDSDVKALEQGGGEMVAPEPIKTEPSKSFGIPGYTGPEKPIFASRSEVAPQAQVSPRATMPQRTVAPQVPETLNKKGKTSKIIGVVVLILLIIAAFGLLGYFVVSYLISPQQMPGV